jgi:radical SAM protein with 4Fe4S-binding SPASM domain
MKQTSWIVFEIITECNLGHIHDKCPNLHPDRYKYIDKLKPITDDKIINLVIEAYDDWGFEGHIGFHFYNEPLMAKERMLLLIKQIKKVVPRAKFVLWTNGLLLSNDCSDLSVFDIAYVSNYYAQNFDRIKKVIPVVNIIGGTLDDRIDPGIKISNAPCRRIYGEFIVDYYGNVHICCYDWRGEVKVGNVWNESLTEIHVKWERIRNSISGRTMSNDAPEICKKCSYRELPDGDWTWRERVRKNALLFLKNPRGFIRKICKKLYPGYN